MRNTAKDVGGLGSQEEKQVEMELLAPQQILDTVDAFYKALNRCQTSYEDYVLSTSGHPDQRLCKAAYYGVSSEDTGFPPVEREYLLLRAKIQEDLSPSLKAESTIMQ